MLPVRADEQQEAHVPRRRETREEIQRRDVAPLQVVHEHDQRVLSRGERLDEVHEHDLETILRFRWGELWNRRLIADDERQIGDEIDDQLSVRAERAAQDLTPPVEALLRLAEQLLDEAAKRPRECAVGVALLELIELALDQVRAFPHDRSAQFGDERRLADARVAGDQAHLRRAVRGAFEQLEERLHLRIAAVEPLRNLEPARDIGLTRFEPRNPAAAAEPLLAALQIGDEPVGALIPILRALGHELRHDRGERRRHVRIDVVRGGRLLADVAVHPLERIPGRERKRAGQELEQHHAERVVVGAVVDVASRAPGLFRREVRQRTFEPGREPGALPFVRQLRADAEVDQADVTGAEIDQHVPGHDVLVNQVLLVNLAERAGQLDDERQDDGEGERCALTFGDDVGQRAAERLHLHRDVAGRIRHERARPDHAGDAKLAEDAKFPADLGGVFLARVLGAERLEDDLVAGGRDRPVDDLRPGLVDDGRDPESRDDVPIGNPAGVGLGHHTLKKR